MSQPEIKGLFEALFAGIEKEQVEASKAIADLPAVQEALTHAENGAVERFHFGLMYPLDQHIEGLLRKVFPASREARFIFQNYKFVESHFKSVIERFEGGACCADKSRTIVNRLVRHFKSGEEVVFNYDGEYTYHLPKATFVNHAEVIAFYKALESLYYGSPNQYLLEMTSVIARVPARLAELKA